MQPRRPRPAATTRDAPSAALRIAIWASFILAIAFIYLGTIDLGHSKGSARLSIAGSHFAPDGNGKSTGLFVHALVGTDAIIGDQLTHGITLPGDGQVKLFKRLARRGSRKAAVEEDSDEDSDEDQDKSDDSSDASEEEQTDEDTADEGAESDVSQDDDEEEDEIRPKRKAVSSSRGKASRKRKSKGGRSSSGRLSKRPKQKSKAKKKKAKYVDPDDFEDEDDSQDLEETSDVDEGSPLVYKQSKARGRKSAKSSSRRRPVSRKRPIEDDEDELDDADSSTEDDEEDDEEPARPPRRKKAKSRKSVSRKSKNKPKRRPAPKLIVDDDDDESELDESEEDSDESELDEPVTRRTGNKGRLAKSVARKSKSRPRRKPPREPIEEDDESDEDDESELDENEEESEDSGENGDEEEPTPPRRRNKGKSLAQKSKNMPKTKPKRKSAHKKVDSEDDSEDSDSSESQDVEDEESSEDSDEEDPDDPPTRRKGAKKTFKKPAKKPVKKPVKSVKSKGGKGAKKPAKPKHAAPPPEDDEDDQDTDDESGDDEDEDEAPIKRRKGGKVAGGTKASSGKATSTKGGKKSALQDSDDSVEPAEEEEEDEDEEEEDEEEDEDEDDEEEPKPPKIVDPLRGAKLAVSSILEVDPDVISKIFKVGAQVGAQIAYCPSAQQVLQMANNSDERAMVASACASVQNDDNVEAIAQGVVVVLNNKSSILELTKLGVPAKVTSVIQCAFAPVMDAELGPGVKIVVGYGPDPAAAPFVEPPEEDDDDEDGDGEGGEGGEKEDSEGEEDEEAERRLRLSRFQRLLKRQAPVGAIDPKKVPNFVCPSGSQAYGSAEIGGFCCSGKVSADNLKCENGTSCAFPGNDKPQGNGVCKDGSRYTCGPGAFPYADFAGGFCCTGPVTGGACKAASCHFPSNTRTNGQAPCTSGTLSRDLTTVGDSSAVSIAEPPTEITPNLPSASAVTPFAVGDVVVKCTNLTSDFSRRISLRLPGLKMSWKHAQPVAQMLLGAAEFTIPDLFGKLPDIAQITQMAFDYDPLPAISTGRIVMSFTDLKLGEDFGLVNLTATVAFDQGSGVSFDLGGTGVLPVYKSGIAFTLPLIVDGDMLPLTLATQDRNVTLGSLLSGLKVDALFKALPQIPLLSGGMNAVLDIQIKDMVFGFCKPGVDNCKTRISLDILLPAALSSFDSGTLPVNIDSPKAVVSLIDPFSANRGVELRITGTWNVQGSPLNITVLRSPVDNNEEMDLTDYSDNERRLRERDLGVEEPVIECYEDEEPEYVPFTLPSYDHWVAFPEPNLEKIGFDFWEMPLKHVNHHMLMHRRRRLKRDLSNSTEGWLERRDAAPAPVAAADTPKANSTAVEPRKKKQKAKVAKNRSKSPKKKSGPKAPPASGGKWLIEATTPSLPVGKLLGALAADIFPAGPITAVIDRSGLRDFAIENFTLFVLLDNGDVVVRLSGAASIFPQAKVQIIFSKQAGQPFGGTMTLALTGDLFTSLLQKLIPGFDIPGLNFVASGSTLGLIVSSRDATLSNTPLVLEPPLDFVTGIRRGFELSLRMGLPPDCGGQPFCEVMKKILGANAALQIRTVVNPPDVMLSAAVTDIRITDGLLLKSVGFSASFPKPELMLSGSMALVLDRSRAPLVFEAHIGLKGGSVVLGATMTGIWERAFGWDRLNLGNIIIELGITAVLGAPSFIVGSEIAIGRNCYTPSYQFNQNSGCIGGALYVSFDPSDPSNNWFGGELNNLDIKHIITAFTDLTPNPSVIPAPLLNSGLPGKTVVSYCPKGNCVVPGRTFPQGFYLKGTLNIFDVTAKVELSIDPGKSIKLDAELSPFTLAGGLIKAYYSKDDASKGPRLKLDIAYASMAAATIQLNAYVKVLAFETQAVIAISPMDYYISFTAQYLLFTCTFSFKASISSSLAFTIGASFSMSSFYQFVDEILAKVTAWAKEGEKTLNDAKGKVDDADRVVQERKKSACDWMSSCQRAKEAVSCGRVKRRHLVVRSTSWEDKFWKEASVELAPPEQRGLALDIVRLARRWSVVGNWFKKAAEDTWSGIKKAAEVVVAVVKSGWDKLKEGVCKGWEVVSGAIIDGSCKLGCTVAQGALDIASAALKAASGVLSGLTAVVKAAATVATWIGEKLKSMINIRSAGFSASLNAQLSSGFASGSLSIHFNGVIFGADLNVDFTIDFNNIIASAGRFFTQFVSDAAKKVASIFRLAQRDLSERDVEFFEDGHFRFKKRDLLDNHDTVLYDSRVHTHDEALDLIKTQIRKRRLAKRELEKRANTTAIDPNDPAASAGQKISADQLPLLPAVQPGYVAGPPPGLEGGEDNDFRIKFGEDLYLSCPALVGAFSRKGKSCKLRRKVHATIFLSVSEPKGMSFRTANGLCLGVDSKSSVVLTQCMIDLPNGVWKYNNDSGQFSSYGAGVAIARSFDSNIELDDIVIASAPSDGKCMTATKKKKVRMSRCLDESDSKKKRESQRFAPRINAESINLGDLITFHSTGQVVNMYIRADPKNNKAGLGKGTIAEQQDDKLAAFKVIDPICGANYHFTLESVAQNGSYLSVDPKNPDSLVITDKPKKKEDACWLPTPGITRADTASGCPGITFSLHSRSRKGFYIRVDNDGKKLFLGNKKDVEMLTCWRPVPPTGAPSAKYPTGEPEDEEDVEADKKVDAKEIQEGEEDVMEDARSNLFGDD